MNDDNEKAASHSAVTAALEALFVEETLEAAFGAHDLSAKSVHEHLADCAACRKLYDGLALTDRLLAGEADDAAEAQPWSLQPAGFEARFGEAAFSSALDEMLAEEAAEAAGDASQGASVLEFPGGLGGPLGWISAAAAVLLVAASSWLIFGNNGDPAHSPADDTFQARSAADIDTHGSFEQPDIEVFCARRSGGDVDFTGKDDAPFGLLSCPLDAELKLAYRNTSSKLRYAAFFGVDQTGNIYPYGPTPSDFGPIAIENSRRLVPIGETIRLEVNHRPGRVRVAAVFATEPIDYADLRRVIDGLDIDRLYGGERPERLSIRGTVALSSFEVIEGDSP